MYPLYTLLSKLYNIKGLNDECFYFYDFENVPLNKEPEHLKNYKEIFISFLNNLQKKMRQLDAAKNFQMDFQHPASTVMEGIIDFHHDLMFILIFIIVLIL
jgi:hypothetical protein